MPHSRRLDTPRGEPVTFTYDGDHIEAYAGETVAAALLAHGVRGVSYDTGGNPRRPLCNMGTCFDCAVVIDGTPLVRSCLTPVTDGMEVQPWRSA